MPCISCIPSSMINMRLTLKLVDNGPDDLQDQLPLKIYLLRKMPGSNRDDYWLAEPELLAEHKQRLDALLHEVDTIESPLELAADAVIQFVSDFR